MKIAVLGTGIVGQTIADKLIELGHDVMLGSREEQNEKSKEWADKHSEKGSAGSFSQAASFAELIFNCTAGMHSLEALSLAGSDNLKGKTLIDIANPLDFSNGMPPTLSVCNNDSLGEQIQRSFPDTNVVKALNTVNAELMVNPSLVPGEHVTFICGDSNEAKQFVTMILTEWFGWKRVVDLGEITSARGTEMFLPLWLRLWGSLGHAKFNLIISEGSQE